MTNKNLAFYFKALRPVDRFLPHTAPESAILAKGTWYEAWFEALKLSPWYLQISESGKFLSDDSQRTWELFGDLRNISFEDWWSQTGFNIFSERIPYKQIRVAVEGGSEEGNLPPMLKIEVPLNLSPKDLGAQFMNILLQYQKFDDDAKRTDLVHYDRWKTSTALAHPFKESKLDPKTIMYYLSLYSKYTKAVSDRNVTLAEFAIEENLAPKFNLKKNERDADRDEKLVKLAGTADNLLSKAKNIMAHATEMVFPLATEHPWNKKFSRKG
jgi:hypothetical protein